MPFYCFVISRSSPVRTFASFSSYRLKLLTLSLSFLKQLADRDFSFLKARLLPASRHVGLSYLLPFLSVSVLNLILGFTLSGKIGASLAKFSRQFSVSRLYCRSFVISQVALNSHHPLFPFGDAVVSSPSPLRDAAVRRRSIAF